MGAQAHGVAAGERLTTSAKRLEPVRARGMLAQGQCAMARRAVSAQGKRLRGTRRGAVVRRTRPR